MHAYLAFDGHLILPKETHGYGRENSYQTSSCYSRLSRTQGVYVVHCSAVEDETPRLREDGTMPHAQLCWTSQGLLIFGPKCTFSVEITPIRSRHNPQDDLPDFRLSRYCNVVVLVVGL